MRLFDIAGDPFAWQSGLLTTGMKLTLQLLSIMPPPNGKYTLHSVRISSHTGQVFLRIPLEALLTSFGW